MVDLLVQGSLVYTASLRCEAHRSVDVLQVEIGPQVNPKPQPTQNGEVLLMSGASFIWLHMLLSTPSIIRVEGHDTMQAQKLHTQDYLGKEKCMHEDRASAWISQVVLY